MSSTPPHLDPAGQPYPSLPAHPTQVPHGPGQRGYPAYGQVPPLVAFPHPISPPAGHAVLVVSVNRGPYLIPIPKTSRLKVAGWPVAIPDAGTWQVAVPAGQHDVRYSDPLGFPLITTTLVAQAGLTHQLSFQFGRWRNRVYDGHGTDVTRFGLWSNYTIMLVTLAAVGVVCCGAIALIGGLAASR